MTYEFKEVYSTVDWENTPDCYKIDPELYRPLVLSVLPAFEVSSAIRMLVVGDLPFDDSERFGTTEYPDDDGETLALGALSDGDEVFEFDIENDCDTRWKFNQLRIERPFINATTGDMTCFMRLCWYSKHTADEMFVDFHAELPMAAEALTED